MNKNVICTLYNVYLICYGQKIILQVTGHNFQVHFHYLSYIHHVKILFKLTVLYYMEQIL